MAFSVSVETTIGISLATFVVGFFTNLIAMRKMFVGKSEFEQYKKDLQETRDKAWEQNEVKCELKRNSCGSMCDDIKEIKADIKELFRELRDTIRNEKPNGKRG